MALSIPGGSFQKKGDKFVYSNKEEGVVTKMTIDFAKELPLLTVNFCILQLMPGSEVRKFAHNYGTVDYRLELGSDKLTKTKRSSPTPGASATC